MSMKSVINRFLDFIVDWKLPHIFLEDLMSEVGDSKEDVRELPIYNKVQKAVYNRLHGHIEDYDRRMDTILSELKDEFRDQLV